MVNIQLNDSDIANMAISIEERGILFYKNLAEKSTKQNVKEIFLRLSEEEKEHREAFKYIFRNIVTGNRMFSPGTAHYLHSLLSTSVFPKEEEVPAVVESFKSPQEALTVGIQAEKDAILLYHELYNNADDEETKKVISKLLEAEKLHLVDLRELMYEWQ